MVQFVEQEALLGFSLFALADVNQHIDRADDLATAVAKWCRIWNDGNPGPVGTLHYDFGVADGPPFLESDRHRALIMRERRTVRAVELPRHAPLVPADRRRTARQFDGCLIGVGNLALGVGHVDSRRD